MLMIGLGVADGLMEAVLDAFLDSLYIVDRELRVVAWNQARERGPEGIPRDTTVGRPLQDVLPPDAFERVKAAIEQVFVTGQVHDDLVELHDGPRVYRTRRLPIVRDGRVTHVLSWFQDVTEQHRATEALRASEDKYRAFFEEDLAANYVSTPDGTLLACNGAYVRLFGFAGVEQALAASAWDHFASGNDRLSFLAALRKQGRVDGHEHELHRCDGTPVPVIETAVGRCDAEGRLVEIRGYLSDDTKRKQAEEQLRQAQKMEAIGRLAGGVAHDFNNLLGVILGYTEMLERNDAPASARRDKLDQIRKAVEQASDLTRQLLAFSRKQVLQPKPLDLNHVVDDLRPMLVRLIGEDVELTTALADALGSAMADAAQLQQVILNLAVNARDAMPHGGRLTIETANVDVDASQARRDGVVGPGRYVVIKVRDTGEGMDARTLAHLFEPFFTTKEQGKGTGLGLATVYGIVCQSGGQIEVDSEPGRGTAFCIYLPRIADAPVSAPVRIAPTKLPGGGSETVLLIEDDGPLRALLKTVLELAGYTVLQAGDPAEALTMADAHGGAIHLALSDIVMPTMNGPEVVARLKERRPGLLGLYMTGYVDDATVKYTIPPAEREILQKPFASRDLLERVRLTLDSRSHARS